MNKEFVPYEEALALKELGFDEPCFAWYNEHGCLLSDLTIGYEVADFLYSQEDMINEQCTAPTFSQAFRWFRYNYWYTALILCDSFEIVMQLSTSKTLDSKTGEYRNNYITQTWNKEVGLKSYDESELACLKRLIEMAKEKAKVVCE
jgi:hypothetical protein